MTSTIIALAVALSPVTQSAKTTVIERTLETSLAQPMVHVFRGGVFLKRLHPTPNGGSLI